MRVLFVSPNYPPEVNAPATRLHEHARRWAATGGQVDVLTDVPNYPEGVVYPGYENAYREEAERVGDGRIRVHRVPMYLAENKGALKRTLSYVSFMVSAAYFSRRIRERPDVVVGTSPQFFCALAGFWIARRLGVPFVMEVRDLWPESIIAVGAMERNAAIRAFERLETYLYRKSDHVVVVTDAFKRHVMARGVPAERISVVKNGADLDRLSQPLDPDTLEEVGQSSRFAGRFVASYAGTTGMAHGAGVLLDAAERTQNEPDLLWSIIGTGAEREALEARAGEMALPNFSLIEKQPKERIFHYLHHTDVAVVHLRDLPLFRTVLPSKLFEAMAFGKPIVLGVEGEAAELIQESGAGLCVPPEDPDALAEAVLRLKRDPDLYARLAENGRRYVAQHFDRADIALRYWRLLHRVAGRPVPAALRPTEQTAT